MTELQKLQAWIDNEVKDNNMKSFHLSLVEDMIINGNTEDQIELIAKEVNELLTAQSIEIKDIL